MRCVTVHTAVLALLGALLAAHHLATAQYLNNRPYPTYSLERMPDTRFTCRDKVLGGYYADSETQCQMFHICVKVAGLGVQDFRFLCPNGTAFDQDNQICAEWDDVDCEAATLYYSSDNFDLYRVGSGYETAAFAGEDEGTFHLQRSETGDARLIREHQSQRVNQQTDYNTVVPPRRPAPPQQRGERDRDILRASQSGNFFNNRNGGKEEDDYYNDDRQPNQNQDVPKKKIVRKFNQRKPVEENYEQPQPQAQTQRPQRPTGFVNNFAGSIRPSSTTLKPTTAEQYQQEPRRQNPRSRGGDRQYNNAENFRNNDYNRNQQVSTPAPFRAPENNNNNNNRQYKNTNRQSTQYDNYSPTTSAPKSTFNNNQYDTQRTTQVARQNYNNNQQYQTKQTENYPSTPAVNKQKQTENYPSTPVKQTFKQTENYPTTPVKQQTYNNNYQSKQTENYPSTPAAQNYNSYQNKQTENYPSTAAKQKQTENYPSTVSPFKQTTQYKKETENYPTTVGFTNNQNYNKQYDIPKKTTQFKQTENYPTTFAPSKQTYQKPTTQYYQPKETENYPQNNKQSTQYDNTRSQYQSSSQQYSTTNRPTTQHTQYTPTVPKQTTQFYASTTPSARFSKQFDETSYDDGSYNAKYDEDKYKQEDEFLKTAHSQNFASARNELLSSTKTGSSITTQSPRPFTVTTPIPRASSPPRQTQSVPKQTQAVQKQTQAVQKQTQAVQKQTSAPKTTQFNEKQSPRPEQPKKKEKDVSYDYAYYDSNVGSEPDYDIGTEFAKSTKKTN